jgi:hypothetical protein
MSLVMLPTRNLYNLQSVSLMMGTEGRNFVPPPEDIVTPLADLEVEPPIPVSVSLDIHAEKKWIHIDPSLVMELSCNGLVDSEMRLARLFNTNIVAPLAALPDTTQLPSGDFMERAVKTGKRKRQDANSLLVSGTPFRLSEFANFASTQFGRP